jgi:hypothetical protein
MDESARLPRGTTLRKLARGKAASAGAALILLQAAGAAAAEYYVAPTGSDANSGSMAAPFASLSKANGAAAAGDTIWVRGGTYYVTTQLVLSKSGTSDTNRTKIWAYAGETPVLDASRYVTSNTAADVPVVLVTGSFMHLRGLEIANGKVGASGDHSYSLLRTKNASNNVFELLHLHHGFGSGLFIDTGNGGNLVLNCDSHDNYDKDGSQGDGQNGDGFGVHYQASGPSTTIRGCRAWNNSDDGYDYISQEVPVITEGSFAMSNGRGSEGNGNGFKVGSSKNGIRHIVRNNVAWKNKAAGFYANHSSGGNTWLNNTSYQNSVQYNMLASPPDDTSQTIILSGDRAHKMRNNVGFPNKNTNMGGVDTASNTWDLNISETAAMFESTSDTGCTGPRDADGNIPATCAFMKLKAASPLIDRGTDVGLAYVGAAPDLGAYEFGQSPPVGAGGSGSGSGGTGAGTSTGGGAGSAAAGGSSSAGGQSGGAAGLPGTGATSASAGAVGVSGSNAGGSTSSSVAGSSGVGGSGSDRGGADAREPAPAAGPSDSGSCSYRVAGHGQPEGMSRLAWAAALALSVHLRRKRFRRAASSPR